MTMSKERVDQIINNVGRAIKKRVMVVSFLEGVEVHADPGARLRPDEIRSLRNDLGQWLTDQGYSLEGPEK